MYFLSVFLESLIFISMPLCIIAPVSVFELPIWRLNRFIFRAENRFAASALWYEGLCWHSAAGKHQRVSSERDWGFYPFSHLLCSALLHFNITVDDSQDVCCFASVLVTEQMMLSYQYASPELLAGWSNSFGHIWTSSFLLFLPALMGWLWLPEVGL